MIQTKNPAARLVIFASVLFLSLGIVANFSSHSIWDDSYIFLRYADNILKEGKIIWNPGGEPVYGLTSLLYLVILIPVRSMIGNPPLALALSSVISGIVFLVLVGKMVKQFTGIDEINTQWILALIYFSLASSVQFLSDHFTNGMDTTFVLSYITVYLLVAHWYTESPSYRRAIVLGVMGWLAFLVRPDLTLYALFIPGMLFLFPGQTEHRKYIMVGIGLSGILLICQLIINKLYFGTPFPLPAYIKSLRSANIGGNYQFTANNYLVAFILNYRVLFLVTIFGIIFNIKRIKDYLGPLEMGAGVTVVALIVYYTFFVSQIMGGSQRFYYHTLPGLILIGAKTSPTILQKFKLDQAFSPGYLTSTHRMFLAVLALFSLIPQYLLIIRTGITPFVEHGVIGIFDIKKTYFDRRADYWVALDEISALPDDLVLATTEIGHPAGMNPNKILVDMGGLNEPAYALYPFSPEHMFRTYLPDVIYMPHPAYQNMYIRFDNSSFFHENYELYQFENAWMNVAIYKKSPYYDQLRKILIEHDGVLKE